MNSKQYFTLKEVRLSNNCPECYSNEGLELTFKQRFAETAFYKAITEDTIVEMHCNTCTTAIFPVRWTHDIEKVVAYQKRAVQPKTKSFKLKKLGWAFVLIDLVILIVILLFVTGILKF